MSKGMIHSFSHRNIPRSNLLQFVILTQKAIYCVYLFIEMNIYLMNLAIDLIRY